MVYESIVTTPFRVVCGPTTPTLLPDRLGVADDVGNGPAEKAH
jgi:hypothetical protein